MLSLLHFEGIVSYPGPLFSFFAILHPDLALPVGTNTRGIYVIEDNSPPPHTSLTWTNSKLFAVSIEGLRLNAWVFKGLIRQQARFRPISTGSV